MTLRNPRLPQQNSTAHSRNGRDRLRKRREKRKSLLENLENRQLLAGPQLIGVQPNEGSLLFDGTVLNVSPREVVFQFDDNSQIDADTLNAIRITRAGEDGVFESASVTTDLGTSGAALMEFRAVQPGSIGNGIIVQFTGDTDLPSRLPNVTVDQRTITIELNTNTASPTRIQDLITAINLTQEARDLIEPIQVTGSLQTPIGNTVVSGTALTLSGANAAAAVTDFGTDGAVRVRLVSQLLGEAGRGTQIQVEQRNFGGPANPAVLVTDQVIRIQLNSAPGFESTAGDFINALNSNPDASALVIASLQTGVLTTPIGQQTPTFSPLTLTGVSDVVVEPGFIGLGESPREVVFRFAEPLPDDVYQIDIVGTGVGALRNVNGELFQDGIDLTRNFSINLGPQVAAVVPEPVRRTENGGLSPDTGIIEVHYNNDQLFVENDANGNPTNRSAENPLFYQLIYTKDTVNNQDDEIINPVSVSYNNVTNIATLDFARPLSRIPDPNNPSQFLRGATRLRVGTSEGLPTPPTEVSLILPSAPTTPVEPGDSFATAFDLNSQWTIGSTTTQSARLSSEIFNETPFETQLPGPDLPGTREIRPDDPNRLVRAIPLDYVRGEADPVDGISVIQYDFAESWLGDDPNRAGIADDQTYFNVISEQQKQRVREVLQLFSEYLGVNFVEVEGEPTSDAFFTIAVGDLYGGNVGATSGEGGAAVVIRDRDGDGIDDLGVMDFRDFEDSTDDQFGDEFFRGAMFLVGQLLGYGYADDLPQPVTQSTDFIFQPGTDNEFAFPSVADIVHGQYLFRPDSTDIDLYEFTVDVAGELSVETLAERLGVPSMLNTSLKLFQASGGTFVEIAQNDDYFSNDSLISINVSPGTYMVGVSAAGNESYDPTIPATGFGGLSEGEYELRIDFRPTVTSSIFDSSGSSGPGVALDGNADGRPGGFFDFWFRPADANTTHYVDKGAVVTGGSLGTVGNPYQNISDAIQVAQPGDTIRVVANGGTDGLIETLEDNFSYQIGFDNNGLPLEDSNYPSIPGQPRQFENGSLDVPQGVQLIVDAGTIIKMSRSRLGVGSVAPAVDRSDASLQLLGTPAILQQNGLPARDSANNIIPGSVIITSINDQSVGAGNTNPFSPDASAGDWGGIDFRGDLDSADEIRRNRELEGVFLNHVQYADLRFGGGAVSIGGRQVVVSPIDMAITRPTIINSRITNSSDAAMAATPDTFAETRFTDPLYQSVSPFTPDYTRIGPEIHGNVVTDNSINGLFVRLTTRTGDVLERVNIPSRFDDTDIPHILTENLVIAGTPGGPVLRSTAPSSLLVRPNPSPNGNVPAGTYVYRITNVNTTGIESAASQPTIPVTLTDVGGIQLSQLPTVGSGSDFVSRRLYRAEVIAGIPGTFSLVAQLNASDTVFLDQAAAGTNELSSEGAALRSRLDASLVIDPGTVLKIDGARIETRFGGSLIAEGQPSLPIVFTGLEDKRYGGGGTFDTNSRGELGELNPGDWGGIYIGHGSSASIDNAVIAGGGGTTRIEGGFASFNALEVHQADLRLTNSLLEMNADGRSEVASTRVGRGDNAPGTIFVAASQPIIFGNDFVDGASSALSFDVNSLNSLEVDDPGRSTGLLDRVEIVGNTGPLIQNNSTTGNAINGLHIRGGTLATNGVWDDVDMVHVITESIEIPNQHIFGGLRLQSDARGSLVVKFESDDTGSAGIVVGGTLIDGSDQLRDIPDRIGGAIQIIGHPDFPVVLTTLQDDFAGAGFTRDGRPAVDTNGDGTAGGELSQQQLSGITISPGGVVDDPTIVGPSFTVLPTGPEVNQGLIIDNDVATSLPGFFEVPATGAGNAYDSNLNDAITYQTPAGAILTRQDLIFEYFTYVEFGGNTTNLSATTITQPPTLIADDTVESRGNFAGPNGQVNWIATSSFVDGVATLFTSLVLEADGGGGLGDIRVISYLDEDIGGFTDDILATVGTPGLEDFRAYTLDGVNRVGFAHGGFYVDDGVNQQNATYAGWAADIFPELRTQIEASTQGYSVPGTIDIADLPAAPDPQFGTVNGPADVTTAFAWDTTATASTSIVTSFLELLPNDPSEPDEPLPTSFDAGLWNGITIREGASDRNVAAVAEEEPNRTAFFGTNDIPSQSQFLGEIAPNALAGDENRRLGFVVDGSITTRDDLDVYSFIAESNTEVWLDIDRTGTRFDSIVELIDANGNVLAASNDSLLSETNPNAIFVANSLNPDAAQPLAVVPNRIPVQEVTISESMVEADGGSFALTVEGQAGFVDVPFDQFLTDPALAIESALEATFPSLGDVSANLLRRSARVVDPSSNTIVRDGDDFVIRLTFDETVFIGQNPPAVSVSTVNLIPGGPPITASVQERLIGSQLQDDYSHNSRDAGMRIRLPGEANTRNLYHVRVRSSGTRDPFDQTIFTNPSLVREGLTIGRYELQIRIREQDERPGTQVRLADIRYATNGLQIIGQPVHSPLLGEEYETSASNETLAEAQPLGSFGVADDLNATSAGPLQSDQLAKSIAGELDSATDVDWYQFEVRYDNLTRDGAELYLSTVFDLDYGSNFARSDMALYVFDSTGALILVGGDSNIADDQPGSVNSSDTGNLGRGSAGVEDPYIGATELLEGTYFVAVANQNHVPQPLDQFFNENSSNPLLRLEPIDSVQRIVEDRILTSGGGTAAPPVIDTLFDDQSIVEFTLDDVNLYVNTRQGLFMVNPFTGENFGNVGNFDQNREFNDVAFAANGELFGYSDFVGPATDNTWFYHSIDTGNASVGASLSTGAGITTFNWDGIIVLDANGNQVGIPTLNVVSNTGLRVEGLTIRERNTTQEGFFVANRPAAGLGVEYSDNLLYRFDERTGLSTGARVNQIFVGNGGAGTNPLEVGRINTDIPANAQAIQLGITNATEIAPNGIAVQSLFDGDTFVLDDLVNPPVTFELDQSFTLTASGTNVIDGDAVRVDNVTFEFDTGSRIELLGDLITPTTTTITIEASSGQSERFELVRLDAPQFGNIPVATLDNLGQPRPLSLIAADLAAAINANMPGLNAASGATDVLFVGESPTDITVSGTFAAVAGVAGTSIPGAVGINVDDNIAPELLIDALANAVRFAGIGESSAGPQIAFPSASAVEIVSGTSFTLAGIPDVTTGNNRVLLLPTDSSDLLAERIVMAIENAQLPNVVATAQGRSIAISGAVVSQVSGNLTAGGVSPGGLVRGIELVGNDLYAITDAGGLFRVTSGVLGVDGFRQIGQYVTRATDLVGINFTGLRAGPASVQNGALSNILFGTTGDGDIYAFNTFGELQPVFAGGRSVISTGIAGATGLDFSTLDYNLWHYATTRSTDLGHGSRPLDNYRGGTEGAPGNTSLVFSYDSSFNTNYPTSAEFPNGVPRLDGEAVTNSYNFPGGAKGTVNSNSFSLGGYSANDQPVLYFNYFLETDRGDDRLRVYVVTEDGTEHLVASNNEVRGISTPDDEFDDPSPVVEPYIDDIDVDVQLLFDNPTDGAAQFWRQARVPLGEFAGKENLSLRIEFSTNGTTTNTENAGGSIRVLPGSGIIEGQSTVINGETFTIDFAPTLSAPSGSQLADLYATTSDAAIINLDGQEYVLNDGSRTVGLDQIGIDVLANALPGTVLRDLTAADIATAIGETVRVAPPPNPVVPDFNFSDVADDPNLVGRNDFIFEATSLPYSGGNLTIAGTGRLGSVPVAGEAIQNTDDVDLLRVDVLRGTTIAVDIDFDLIVGLSPVVRFFDQNGDELVATPNLIDGTIDHVAANDGTIFIGISGLGNETYDPRVPGTTSAGQVDSYTANVSLNLPQAVLIDSNAVEFNGSTSLSTSHDNLFLVTGTDQLVGVPLQVSRFMSSSEVAEQLQRAVANRFRSGDLSSYPTSGPTVSFPGLTVTDPGPFALESARYGDIFKSRDPVSGAVDRTRGAVGNNFEGVYLDDFIIGFAERGEIATGANVDDTFVTSGLPTIPVPNDPVSSLQTGTYQVEIRDASEYVATGVISSAFRAFDTNDRLAPNARSITARSADQLQDGWVFSISDGRATVEFEFDLIESNTGSTPGRVRVPYTLRQIEPGTEVIDPLTNEIVPGTGVIRPQTETEIANQIINAINQSEVQSVIEVSALLSSGVDAVIDGKINLFGNLEVNNSDGALADVSLVSNRGDDNRDRESQGVILIENSRFLLNEQYGIDITHDLTTTINGEEIPNVVRYPRNLVKINSERTKPGVVVQSSVFAFNGVGGLQISGIDPTLSETGADPVPFERIVNNTFIGGTIVPGSLSPASEFNGILFDSGATSFADSVVSYEPSIGGGAPLPAFQDATTALGIPDATGRGPEPIDGLSTVSLGLGGTLTVEFTDNLLTGSGDSRPDLVVFETGAVESVRVEISRDGVAFFDVGILGGLTNQLDIDAAGFGPQDRFAFVRLTDLRQGDTTIATLGADIDAIGALSSAPVDDFQPAGIGVNIVNGAAPTLLNNVIANTENGLVVDPANDGFELGGNSYYRNTTDVPTGVSLGQFSQVIPDSEVIFTAPTELVFAPSAGASIIDSSIGSLEDRDTLTTVRNPLGIPPSPIIAPRLDVNGQLRVDDPNVETPSGLGERVFSDRGASDRGDLDGPRVVLLSPRAPGLGTGAGVVNVLGDAPAFFEIQLIDGLAPADVTPGTGIDDETVDSDAIIVLQNNVALVEGIDYRFGYNPSTNIIRLTPIAGVWQQNSSYVIRMVDASDAIVAALDGGAYVDGGILNVLDRNGNSTAFEYETGLRMEISTSLTGATADGITFTLFDGTNQQTFELDSDGLFINTENIRVNVPAAGNSEQIAEALATVIDSSLGLNFDVNLSGSTIQLLGGTPLSFATTNSNFVNVNGSIGTEIGFGLQIPAIGAAPDTSIADGQSFTVRRGAIAEEVFELDFDGILNDPEANRVALPLNPTLDQIADAIVRATGGTTLGLDPSNQGFGRVFLGGDSNNSLDLTNSVFTQLGLPGDVATVPIEVPVQNTASEVSPIIATVIESANLAGVAATIVDSRVFLEGTGGINGIGAVDLVTIEDEVGNQLQSNQPSGRTELTIFVGSGFDYGDAPAPYVSLDSQGGPRHAIDASFSLGATVTPEANAVVPNGDSDDGVFVTGSLEAAFTTNFNVNINNVDGRTFYLDAWFDWDGDGVFELGEKFEFGSADTGRLPLSTGNNVIPVTVPPNAASGEIYARFRLSEDSNIGPLGDATSGEVEDVRLVIGGSPFQNASNNTDVNANGDTTPLDALLVINALSDYADNFGQISLQDTLNLPSDLPPFPDVDGNGFVTPNDALQVINRLSQIARSGGAQFEQTSDLVQTSTSGVLSTATTALGDQLIREELGRNEVEQLVETSPQGELIEPSESKTSVFDEPVQAALDSIVDSLAADHASQVSDESETGGLDELFAQF